MEEICRVELFGGLRVVRADEVVSAFPTRKAAALLAYLAYPGEREQSREVLAEMLWPGVDARSGRNSLSVALSAIRRILEPAAVAPGAALITDRFAARLDTGAVVTDVREFEALLDACWPA